GIGIIELGPGEPSREGGPGLASAWARPTALADLHLQCRAARRRHAGRRRRRVGASVPVTRKRTLRVRSGEETLARLLSSSAVGLDPTSRLASLPLRTPGAL